MAVAQMAMCTDDTHGVGRCARKARAQKNLRWRTDLHAAYGDGDARRGEARR